jgi:WD40 repeat protein
VNEVAFSPDGKLLATASADGVQLWYPATRQAVGTFVQAETPLRIAVPRASTNPDFGPTWVAFSADGKLLATVSGNGTVQTWQMSEFANPHAALCADVGLPTKAEWAKYAPGESQPSVCR